MASYSSFGGNTGYPTQPGPSSFKTNIPLSSSVGDKISKTVSLTTSKAKLSKPLRKLTNPLERSSRPSIDLDRPSAEQTGLGLYTGGSSSILSGEYGERSDSRSAVDLTLISGGGSGSTPGGRRAGSGGTAAYISHGRSASGTSQFSTGSASVRGGSFQHPWQQTPRPYTPPSGVVGRTSFTGSTSDFMMGNNSNRASETGLGMGGLGRNDTGEIESAALQELADRHITQRSASSLSTHTMPHTHRESSSTLPSLRITTKTSDRSRLRDASSSNLSTSLLSSDLTSLTSPIDSTSPVTHRASMDRDYRYRLRSRSDLQTSSHSGTGEHEKTIQELRRKFAEKQRVKDEKMERDAVRKLEKQNIKEAKQIEKAGRKSTASDNGRPKYMRQTSNLSEKTGMRNSSARDMTDQAVAEGLFARDYDSAPVQTPPVLGSRIEDQEDAYQGFPGAGPGYQRKKGVHATKRKANSAWTTFVMWLRTRFLRISKKTQQART